MDPKEMQVRMKEGRVYYPSDNTIMDYQLRCIDRLYDYNATRPLEQEKRQEIMKDMFGSIGEGCYIEPPIRSNFGCKHCFFGDNVYANFNLTLVDDANIYVGDNVMFAPNVVVATAAHPILPILRKYEMQYNKEVHIGNNVWVGAGVIILPGVTIGDNSVIGAGSIVTKDIPSDVVAYGNPCKVARKISDRDREFFYKNEKIDFKMDELEEYMKLYRK